MTRKRECKDCKKELTGKYYLIVGAFMNGYEASRANFCSSCCDKWKKKTLIKKQIERGEAKIVEKEVGNKIDDEISEFEDKWEKHSELDIQKKNLPDNETFLNLIQKARQELEPYLQKLKIVEKAWEKEYNTDIDMSFYYLFAKSVRKF